MDIMQLKGRLSEFQPLTLWYFGINNAKENTNILLILLKYQLPLLSEFKKKLLFDRYKPMFIDLVNLHNHMLAYALRLFTSIELLLYLVIKNGTYNKTQ